MFKTYIKLHVMILSNKYNYTKMNKINFQTNFFLCRGWKEWLKTLFFHGMTTHFFFALFWVFFFILVPKSWISFFNNLWLGSYFIASSNLSYIKPKLDDICPYVRKPWINIFCVSTMLNFFPISFWISRLQRFPLPWCRTLI